MTKEVLLNNAVERNIIVYDDASPCGSVSSRLLKLMTIVGKNVKIRKIFLNNDCSLLDNHPSWTLYKFVIGHIDLWKNVEIVDYKDITKNYKDELLGALPFGKSYVLMALFEDGNVLLGAY